MLLRSGMCRQGELESEVFQAWGARMGQPAGHLHRKIWEWCYIAQALWERDMLRPGRRGLGFAVGREPLADLFASLGCEIVATDVETDEAVAGDWVARGMHADSVEALNWREICEPGLFRERATFRFVDMRHLPPAEELGSFDFLWSACSLEHLGSLAMGEQFVYDALRYLRTDGGCGVCVHTMEFNVGSDDATISRGPTVLYRMRDLRRMAAELNWRGYGVDLDFRDGDLLGDQAVDVPPYQHKVHLKLLMDGYRVTSFGLIGMGQG